MYDMNNSRLDDILRIDDLSTDEIQSIINFLEDIFSQVDDLSLSLNFKEFITNLVKTTYWASQNYSDNPYLDICIQFAHEIDLFAKSISNEPPYHSRKHFQDVCVALTLLLQNTKLKTANTPWSITCEESWILLLCAIGHDFGHNGSINTSPSQLEKASINYTIEFLSKNKINEAWRSKVKLLIEPIILATDLTNLELLISKFDDPLGDPTKIDCLSMLLVESDLLASTLPRRGILLGQQLSQEWSEINPIAAAAVISNKGRKAFLNRIRFISPQSTSLQMENIRSQSIDSLGEIN